MLPGRRDSRRPGKHPHKPHSSVAEPPAAAIFSLADSLNACAETCSVTPPSSPEPSTLTGWARRPPPPRAGVADPGGAVLAAVRKQLGEPVQVHDLEDDLVAGLVLQA